MPKVSIILAVRNGLPLLREAVNSVLKQTYKDFEFIIIDDASTDLTASYLFDISKVDKRIRVAKNISSLGLTKSLNLGLKLASGMFIARIDHDDIWFPSKLSRQLDLFEREPEVVIVSTDYSEEDIRTHIRSHSAIPLAETDIEIRKKLYRFNPFFHSSVMFKRDVIDRVGGYDETFRYAQDYEMWTRILTCGRGHTIPDVLCVRRVGKENISIRKERAQRFNALRAKFAWCSRNGFSWQVIMPALRDLMIVVLPGSIKALVRGWLHKAHSA